MESILFGFTLSDPGPATSGKENRSDTINGISQYKASKAGTPKPSKKLGQTAQYADPVILAST